MAIPCKSRARIGSLHDRSQWQTIHFRCLYPTTVGEVRRQRERDIPRARGRAFLTWTVDCPAWPASDHDIRPTRHDKPAYSATSHLSLAPYNLQHNTAEAKTANMQSTLENDIVRRLRQENAALRAELLAMRLFSTSRDERTFDFLKLPRELRNLVYECCVAVGEVRIGGADWVQQPDMRYKLPKSAKAELSLFTVNKQIRLEALEVYLSKNHFVVPNAAMWWSSGPRIHFTRRIPGLPKRSVVHEQWRSVSIPVDFRGIPAEDDGTDSINLDDRLDTSEEVSTMVERHNEYAFDFYFNALSTLAHIIPSNRQLRRLQINVQNATCRLGCHRLVVMLFNDGEIKNQLNKWISKATNHRIESLEFLGTINDEERFAIRSAFPYSLRPKIRFYGRFDRDLRTWDPKVEVFDGTMNEQDAVDSSSQEDYSKDYSSA